MGARHRFSGNDVLDLVNRRAAGESPTHLAEEYGTTTNYVRVVTNRVRTADALHHDDEIYYPSHQGGSPKCRNS